MPQRKLDAAVSVTTPATPLTACVSRRSDSNEDLVPISGLNFPCALVEKPGAHYFGCAANQIFASPSPRVQLGKTSESESKCDRTVR
jgi:hypothetical protein